MGLKSVFSVNLEYLLTRPGIMKLLTLIFGVFTLGLGIHGISESMYNDMVVEELENEAYFESTVSFVFIVSFFYLVLLCFSDAIVTSNKNRWVDCIYHAVAGKSLIVAGILMIVSTSSIQNSPVCKTFKYFANNDKEKKCQLSDYKYAGAVFALFNAVVYEVTAYVVYTTTDT